MTAPTGPPETDIGSEELAQFSGRALPRNCGEGEDGGRRGGKIERTGAWKGNRGLQGSGGEAGGSYAKGSGAEGVAARYERGCFGKKKKRLFETVRFDS